MIIFIPLGIVASIFQIVLLREFSFSIAKNELGFIVAAGFWIISCSLGSITKAFKKFQSLPLFISLCLSFSISACLIHSAKSLIGLKYYEAAGLGIVLISSILLIGPTAFIIGNIFRNLSQEYLEVNRRERNVYAKFFAFEAMGFFIGGLAFTLYLNNYANPLVFSILPALLIPGIKDKYKKILASLLILSLTLISFSAFNFILRKEFNNGRILVNLGSPYGPVIAVSKAGTTMIFSEGSLLASSEDKAATEDFIHMGLSALNHLEGKDMLFIGPSLSGQIEEIIKYGPRSLDCIQINPIILKLSKEKLPNIIRNRVNFIANDPRLYLKNTNKRYDAILMSMPAPSSLSLNRYFTEEFFKLASLRLKPKGIFSFSIPSKREILSPQFSRFNSSIINTVDKVFAHRFIIPSDSMIITSSNGQIIKDSLLLDNFSAINPKTEFFTIYHFKDYLNPSIRKYAQSMLDERAASNTDLNPAGFLNYLILEQIKFFPNIKIDFEKSKQVIIISLLILFLFLLATAFFSGKFSCFLNTAVIGFTSIGLSSIIFVLFQAYCGALFWKLGLLIALFMAGLSLGIFFMNALGVYRHNLLSIIYLCWTITVFILFSSLKIIGGVNYAEVIFYLYSLICGFLTGSSYPVLAERLIKNRFDPKKIATAIYSADLTGAFLGTLICGILLIPFLGIPGSLIVLLLINAALSLKNIRN